MEMEDHLHRPHHHQYSLSDFRHLIPGTPPPPSSSPPQPPPPPPPHNFSSIPSQPYLPLPPCQHLEIMLMDHHHHHQQHQHQQANDNHHIIPPYRTRLHELCDNNNSTASASVKTTSSTIGADGITPAMSFSALEVETGGAGLGGADASTGRWPRQETLTLLEIRSRLDSRFKEANQKGPLWDEVSRIMSEEHGYHRSGKKCREKFENLYKYYKKTKEGKAGRQDGKHYRFFRQLEALYGENTSNNTAAISEAQRFAPDQGQSLRYQPPVSTNQGTSHQSRKFCESLTLSSSSNNFTTSSSDDDNNEHKSLGLLDQSGVCAEKRKEKSQGGGRSWKVKVKHFIDSQMRKIMEKQEAWMEKMMKALEEREKERVLREEEWRKEETERIEREHKFWAKERAWIESRDAALMEALQHFAGADELAATIGCQEISTQNNHNLNEMGSDESMESAKIGCLGYDRTTSNLICKGKSDSIKEFLRKTNGDSFECTKKRKDNNSGSCYNHSQNGESIYPGGLCEFHEHGQEMTRRIQLNYHGSSPSSSNAGNAIQDSCFRFLMGDGDDHLWEDYGSKINKGSQN